MATTDSAQLAWDTILHKPTRGIPTGQIHPMEHRIIERIAGVEPGSYRRAPERTYIAMLRHAGVCLLDQFLPVNALTMGDQGFESPHKTATTGAERTELDGIVIDAPETVVEHLERIVFPRLKQQIAEFDEESRVCAVLADEAEVQAKLGPGILKSGYGFVWFPTLHYYQYGYGPYFSAYALYPEVIERHFALQADLALLQNRAAARAYAGALCDGGRLAPLYRLDHDMADSRGTLVRVETLDRLWFPHFARCLEPLMRTDLRLIWHCDGNLMQMVPRLLEVGLHGFQGFQYEDGMDYARIAQMRTRDGQPLTIVSGVSVTRTLPMGRPEDVKREIDWLVEHGPRTGLFLAGSSSITPGVPWENIRTMLEGFAYYRTHGVL